MDYYIFGIQRSGTNYIESLIRDNFVSRKMNRTTRSWKHSINVPRNQNKNIFTVIIHKNPYTWTESICYRNKVDWTKTQFHYPADDRNFDRQLNVGPDKLNIINLAKTWNHFHKTWITDVQLNCDKYIIIRYEDLLTEETRENVLHELQNVGFDKKNDRWVDVDTIKVSQSKNYDTTMNKYYLNMMPEKLTRYQIDAINQNIDHSLFKKMNYSLL